MEKLSNELAGKLLNVIRTAPEIEKIMKDNGFSNDICEKGAKLLNATGWTSDDFWKFIEDNDFNHNIFEASVSYLNFNSMSKDRAFKFIKKLNFWWRIIEMFEFRIPELSEDELIQIMQFSNSPKTNNLCSPLVNFKAKTEDQLWELFLLRFHVNSPATLKIAVLLKDKNHFYTLIDKAVETKSANQIPLIQLCAKKLKFNKLSEKELFKLATKYPYATFLNREIIKHIKDPAKLLTMSDNPALIPDAINQVNDNDDLIMLLVKKDQLSDAAYKAAIPRLTDEENIEYIWDFKGTEEISKLVIRRINFADKNEAELAQYIRGYYDGEVACLKAKPYLNFEKKSDKEAIEFLKKTDYDETACAMFLPLMGLEKKSQTKMFEILKDSGFNENVGKVLIKHIDDKKLIIDIVEHGGHGTRFWIGKFSKLISKMDDKELATTTENFKHDSNVLQIIIPFLKSAKIILELLRSRGYKEELSKIALKRLGELN
jgi:hypothetical protein